MAKKYDLAVPNGTYQKDGQQKTRWLNIGAIFSKSDGNGFVMKLDAIPTHVVDQDGNSVAFNGWVNMFEPQPREEQQAPAQQQAAPTPPPMPAQGFDDDIPF